MRHAYKLVVRPQSGGRGSAMTYSLIVPPEIGRLLVERGIRTFQPELTEDGILYHPMENGEAKPLPKWLRPDDAYDGGQV